MRFRFNFFGVDILELEFAWPSRGVFPVPDWIPSEIDREFDGVWPEED